MVDISELRSCMTTIKRGHYGLLDISAKLQIFRQLVDQAIATDIFREELDEYIKQQRALGAARREEALEEGKKNREDKGHLKLESDTNDVADNHNIESTESNLHLAANENHRIPNGDVVDKKIEVIVSRQNHASEKRLGPFNFFL